jgi:HK97 gp10 family phage protein
MAKASGSLELGMEFPELTELREQFKELPKNIAAKHLGAALRKAMAPGQTALRKNTPKGPTGNLRKSIKTKIKVYAKDGNAVGLVGYAIGQGSLGYHQGFLEFGTKERKTKKGRFASSWKSSSLNNSQYVRGGFTILNPKRGRNAGKLVTSPKPPKAFFKTAKAGQVVNLGKMPVGGRTGVPPVKTSFNQAQPAMRSLLQQELATRLEKALNEVKGRVARGLIT